MEPNEKIPNPDNQSRPRTIEEERAENKARHQAELEEHYKRLSYRDRSVHCCFEHAINLLNGGISGLLSPEFEDVDNSLCGITAVLQQGLDYVQVAYLKYLTEKTE